MQHHVIKTDSLTYGPRIAERDIHELVDRHMALVRRIAWHVHGRVSNAIDVEDLIQIGLIALVEAARCFEDRGIDFAPYASMRIRGAMIDTLRRDAPIGRSGMADRRRLAKARTQLEQKLMRPPSDAELATALGLDGMAFHAMLSRAEPMRQESIDDSYSEYSDWFADQAENAEDAIAERQLHAALAQHIAQLDQREALVLQLYFAEELNLHEIGEALGVGAARICQIKKAALTRLQQMMTQKR